MTDKNINEAVDHAKRLYLKCGYEYSDAIRDAARVFGFTHQLIAAKWQQPGYRIPVRRSARSMITLVRP